MENDILIALLRLRLGQAFRSELEGAALVRELHTFGIQVPVGTVPRYEWQHRGYGQELLTEAERISIQEFDMKRILITSGIGVRGYYRKFGYHRVGPYMFKKL